MDFSEVANIIERSLQIFIVLTKPILSTISLSCCIKVMSQILILLFAELYKVLPTLVKLKMGLLWASYLSVVTDHFEKSSKYSSEC